MDGIELLIDSKHNLDPICQLCNRIFSIWLFKEPNTKVYRLDYRAHYQFLVSSTLLNLQAKLPSNYI